MREALRILTRIAQSGMADKRPSTMIDLYESILTFFRRPHASPLAAPSPPWSSAVENATGRTVLRSRCCKTRGASETLFYDPPHAMHNGDFSAETCL